MRTLGVEEEFLLVTPDGAPHAVSGAVLRFASLDPPAVPAPGRDEPGGSIEKEFKQEQVEISTRPRQSLTDLLAEVRAGREVADAYARRAGARIAALGTAPQAVESTVLADRRAHEIRARFGQTAREQLTCGCHVHVEVADDDEGVLVLDHLRAWTPVLLALSANSPSWQGRTTGYASYRSQVWGRWPTAGPTAPFGDGAGYRRVVADLLRSGTILDDGMVYFDARLSAHYPTVEVRVADVCLDAGDAVLQAGLVRALAETAVREGRRDDHPRTELLRAATWRAARSGLSGDLVSPSDGLPRPAADVVGELLDHVHNALVDAGDLELVERLLGHVLRRGNGAVEQLAWRAEGAQDDEVVRRAVDRTVPVAAQA
ncbi:glutamate--cysteine ligase [Cellulomonas sp.]|uniref:carboxylate-amine ligase n=1 Tax=Cellulomonas sp. TaxID=40001 RepID=UPI001B1C8E67|nr:glutamate--cysteine ligase [Cellulomonas sp.]MBO9555654.1 glutamate--cysteine ligase [Cellulomonas sp.]